MAETKTNDSAKEKKKKFDWSKHLDPNNDEVFKEGDHTPPAPFIEVARNPSDKNISRWLEYLDLKNKLATRLQTRMSEYLRKNGKIQNLPAPTRRGMQVRKEVISQKQASRFKIRMYFESTCPHCKRMMGTLENLQQRGYYVEALQIDKAPLLRPKHSIHIQRAGSTEVQKRQIRSVPYILIADLEKKVISQPVQGYQNVQQMENIISLMARK